MSSNEIALSHIVITVSTQFSLAIIPSSMKKKTFSGLELMPKRTIIIWKSWYSCVIMMVNLVKTVFASSNDSVFSDHR